MKRIHGHHYLPDPRKATYDHDTGLFNTVAYAAQSAWLLNATIRENILFGEPYDAQRYAEVIRACALLRDLETLEGGDLTEIGEKVSWKLFIFRVSMFLVGRNSESV
jgi:ABC-type transport system involved in cytochrome bd biosynthesis fused ATPase/permease subunit